MTTKIDLERYASEVEAFIRLADDFVDKASTLRLDHVLRALRAQIDSRASPLFWSTEREIVIRSSEYYDGPGKKHLKTDLSISFDCVFLRDANADRKDTKWGINRISTHLSLKKDGYELPFHFDYKNSEQWGPQVHFQVSEILCDIPIPRLLSNVCLPTDCLDLMLSELHPVEWQETQQAGRNNVYMSKVRTAQENRILAHINELKRLWEDDKRTTRVNMLQNYTSALSVLPSW